MWQRLTSKQNLSLVTILLFALLLRVIFFHGISQSDPFTYSLSAWEITQGKWNPGYFYEQTSRWGLLFPLALSYQLFGLNEFSSSLWALLTSVGTVLVGYLFAGYLKGERAAFLAGIMLAVFPLEITYASQPMADCPLGFWLLLSLYLFMRAEGSAAVEPRRRLFLFSGAALGLAYATKFVAILIAPFFLIVLLLRRRIEWNWSWFAGGFGIVLLIELLIFQLLTGNALKRLELILHDNTGSMLVMHGGAMLSTSVWQYGYWLFVDFHYVGLVFIFLLLILLSRTKKYWQGKNQILANCWQPILWSVVLLLILTFYPMKVRPYLPLYKIQNYILMFSAPLVVVLAVFLSEYTRKIQRIALVLIFASTLPFVFLVWEGYRAHGDNTRALREFYAAHRDRPLYVHRTDQRLLQYYDGFKHNDDYRNYRLPGSENEIANNEAIDFQHTYVALNKYLMAYHTTDKYPAEILNPPANWRIVYTYQRPPHRLRTYATQIGDWLQSHDVISTKYQQLIDAKMASWSPSDPVIIYAVE